jgi:membrane protease YdiL (CAAX protease family)
MPLLILLAWASTLIISSLPDILFRELSGALPAWLYWAKVGALALLLAAAIAWGRLRPLRLYFAALLGLYIAQWGVGEIYSRLNIADWFAGSIPFIRELLSVQIPRVTLGALMVLYLWALTRDLRRFFFVPGNRDAIAAPIPWIFSEPTPWRRLGPIACACLLAGMTVIVWLMGSHPTLQQIAGAAPYLPWILLFAAANSFGEELSYRATLLSGLEGPAGGQQALAISAVYFGLAHFYGVPYGVGGVILSTLMGWFLGKSMLENRGFTWPWLLHVCLDTVIFSFMAIGSITPGG